MIWINFFSTGILDRNVLYGSSILNMIQVSAFLSLLLVYNCITWIPCKFVVLSHSISWKDIFSNISRMCTLSIINSAVPVLIIFGKIYFLSITEKEFFHGIKRDGMTIFMDFMRISSVHLNPLLNLPNARKSIDFKCHYPHSELGVNRSVN